MSFQEIRMMILSTLASLDSKPHPTPQSSSPESHDDLTLEDFGMLHESTLNPDRQWDIPSELMPGLDTRKPSTPFLLESDADASFFSKQQQPTITVASCPEDLGCLLTRVQP